MGQVEEGLEIVADALTLVTDTEGRFNEAELHRLKGELLLSDERRTMNDERQTLEGNTAQHTAEAEECFQQALEVARSQQAKSWELRTATNLARLWQ